MKRPVNRPSHAGFLFTKSIVKMVDTDLKQEQYEGRKTADTSLPTTRKRRFAEVVFGASIGRFMCRQGGVDIEPDYAQGDVG
jgi:hypothetical protein